MKRKYHYRIPLEIFSGKLMLVVVLFTVSSLSFILGYYVGRNSGSVDTVVNEQNYQIADTTTSVRTTGEAVEKKGEGIAQSEEVVTADITDRGIVGKEVPQRKSPGEKVAEKTPRRSSTKKTGAETRRIDRKFYYSIQVGAFKSKSQAEVVKRRLKRKGYYVSIAEGGNLYKVRVGRFETRGEAGLFLKKIREREKLQGIIVKSRG
ncbi:MAG TPA: SPOR domain-containing protein [Nitrospirae bacterium]|nr:SPOR domain-containing protein [Nitrospirota bacterium]